MNQSTSQCQLIQTHFKGSSFARDPCNVVWFAPISPFTKLNIDESSLGNIGSSGFKGIGRDSQGLWFFEFYGHYGHTTNMHVVLLAIINRMCHAWNNIYHHRDVHLKKDVHLMQTSYASSSKEIYQFRKNGYLKMKANIYQEL